MAPPPQTVCTSEEGRIIPFNGLIPEGCLTAYEAHGDGSVTLKVHDALLQFLQDPGEGYPKEYAKSMRGLARSGTFPTLDDTKTKLVEAPLAPGWYIDTTHMLYVNEINGSSSIPRPQMPFRKETPFLVHNPSFANTLSAQFFFVALCGASHSNGLGKPSRAELHELEDVYNESLGETEVPSPPQTIATLTEENNVNELNHLETVLNPNPEIELKKDTHRTGANNTFLKFILRKPKNENEKIEINPKTNQPYEDGLVIDYEIFNNILNPRRLGCESINTKREYPCLQALVKVFEALVKIKFEEKFDFSINFNMKPKLNIESDLYKACNAMNDGYDTPRDKVKKCLYNSMLLEQLKKSEVEILEKNWQFQENEFNLILQNWNEQPRNTRGEKPKRQHGKPPPKLQMGCGGDEKNTSSSSSSVIEFSNIIHAPSSDPKSILRIVQPLKKIRDHEVRLNYQSNKKLKSINHQDSSFGESETSSSSSTSNTKTKTKLNKKLKTIQRNSVNQLNNSSQEHELVTSIEVMKQQQFQFYQKTSAFSTKANFVMLSFQEMIKNSNLNTLLDLEKNMFLPINTKLLSTLSKIELIQMIESKISNGSIHLNKMNDKHKEHQNNHKEHQNNHKEHQNNHHPLDHHDDSDNSPINSLRLDSEQFFQSLSKMDQSELISYALNSRMFRAADVILMHLQPTPETTTTDSVNGFTNTENHDMFSTTELPSSCSTSTSNTCRNENKEKAYESFREIIISALYDEEFNKINFEFNMELNKFFTFISASPPPAPPINDGSSSSSSSSNITHINDQYSSNLNQNANTILHNNNYFPQAVMPSQDQPHPPTAVVNHSDAQPNLVSLNSFVPTRHTNQYVPPAEMNNQNDLVGLPHHQQLEGGGECDTGHHHLHNDRGGGTGGGGMLTSDHNMLTTNGDKSHVVTQESLFMEEDEPLLIPQRFTDSNESDPQRQQVPQTQNNSGTFPV